MWTEIPFKAVSGWFEKSSWRGVQMDFIEHSSHSALSEAFSFRTVTAGNVIILRGKLFGNKIFYFFLKESRNKKTEKIYK